MSSKTIMQKWMQESHADEAIIEKGVLTNYALKRNNFTFLRYVDHMFSSFIQILGLYYIRLFKIVTR